MSPHSHTNPSSAWVPNRNPRFLFLAFPHLHFCRFSFLYLKLGSVISYAKTMSLIQPSKERPGVLSSGWVAHGEGIEEGALALDEELW